MKKTHLALMAAVSTSLVSSIGAFCQTRGNSTPPSDADPLPEAPPTVPGPHIITVSTNPISLPSLCSVNLYNPFTGYFVQADICVSPYPEGGDGQILIYLSQPVNMYGATVTNTTTGHACVINAMTSSYVSALAHGNGVYVIRISTSQGEYTGTISVNNLSGPQVPCYTIDDGAEGGFLTLPPSQKFHP